MPDYNILLSYPRSGNHVTRFLIELLCERPTSPILGSKEEKGKPVHTFQEFQHLPFRVKDPTNFIYYKAHAYDHYKTLRIMGRGKLILIVRDPREIVVRHGLENTNETLADYFDLLQIYETHNEDKVILVYEDIISNPAKFVDDLIWFLGDDVVPGKHAYVAQRAHALISISGRHEYASSLSADSKGNRTVDFYTKTLSNEERSELDKAIAVFKVFPAYSFIQQRYHLP